MIDTNKLVRYLEERQEECGDIATSRHNFISTLLRKIEENDFNLTERKG